MIIYSLMSYRRIRKIKIFAPLFCAFFFSTHLYALCVSTSKANLRKGPGTKYPISWVVGRYMPLLKIENKGSWIRVKDLDGEKHWVYNQNVTREFRCLAVKTTVSSLRTGPGKKFPYAKNKLVDKYTPFKYIDSDEEYWYNVQDRWGDKYWIHSQNVWRPLSVSTISF